MKLTKWSLLGLCTLFLWSCKEEAPQPKVIYDTTNTSPKVVSVDTSSYRIADLPIQFEGTDVLLFPVGALTYTKDRSNYGKYSGESGINYTISNVDQFEIAGNLTNVKFQIPGKDTLIALTNKPIHIERLHYLNGIAARIKKQYVVYKVQDLDTNKDGKCNENDINSLYISRLDGSEFQKLSTDYHELIDWNTVDTKERLYFRTVEDLNKNGAFDKADKVHYYYVNLGSKELKPTEYNPLQ